MQWNVFARWTDIGGILEEIPKPISFSEKELTLTTKEDFETKYLKRLTITVSIRRTIRTQCTIDLMSNVGDMGLTSKMWKRFKSLYRDTEFIKRNSIFISLTTPTFLDFNDFV